MSDKISDLIRGADRGDSVAAQELFTTLYHELHTLAEHHLRRQSGELTIGATTLLHETYLNLADRSGTDFPDRLRFFAYASAAMRGLIIDYSRARRAKKRGGEFEITQIGDENLPGPAQDQWAGLAEAIESLQAVDPPLAQLVDLHFFCGLSFVEIAALRGVSDRTIHRDWRKARMLLRQSLEPS